MPASAVDSAIKDELHPIGLVEVEPFTLGSLEEGPTCGGAIGTRQFSHDVDRPINARGVETECHRGFKPWTLLSNRGKER